MNSLLGTGFRYTCEATLPTGEVLVFEEHNLLPQVSIDHVAGLIQGSASPISGWYVGIFEGNYTPSNTTAAADLPTNAGECVDAALHEGWQGIAADASELERFGRSASL